MEDKMIIDLADIPPVPIVLGLAGENNFRSFTFDASTWGAGYPSARYNVVYKRPDGYLYPVVLNADTDELVWSPNATDTAVNGDALVEVRLLQGDVVGKTVAMQAIVLPSISGDESEPDKPAPDWVNDVSDDADRAEAAVEHYPQIRNGELWVWNINTETWEKLDVSGEGGGSATVVVTIDDTTVPPTASMTAADIKAAVDRNERVVARISGVEIPFVAYVDSTAFFSSLFYVGEAPAIATIVVTASGGAIISHTTAATLNDIPTQQQMAAASIFIAVRGTTTEAEIRAAHSAGKVVICVYQNRVYYLSEDSTVMLRTAPNAQGKVYTLVVVGDRWTGITYDLALASAIPTKTSQLTNDSIKEPVYLTVTVNTDTITVDKTPAEINALSAAGHDVHVRIQIPLYSAMCDMRFVGFISNTEYAAFSAEYRGSSVAAVVAPDKSVEIYTSDLHYRVDQVENDIAALEADKADKVPRVAMTAADEVVALNPNTLYVFPEMSALTITLAAPADLSIVNEYHFIFSSGATATVTDFPQIPGLADFAAEANTAYEISICEGRALVVSWEVSA